ncbi:hypothetical protein BDZ89DRAFT_1224915 [Hymenopellis radicata]|nr:hypothetical protein BDZ89DRAFT_1224915 [Hymenopellis radicata]
MKLIHHGGSNNQERDSYKEIIYSNTIQSMRAILEALSALALNLLPANEDAKLTIHCLPSSSMPTRSHQSPMCMRVPAQRLGDVLL